MANHKKQFCPKGHDTFITGRTRGACKICRKEYERMYNITHKTQQKASVKRWADANKDRTRDTELRRIYGITLVDFTKMCDEQKLLCKICKLAKPLVVDHDHKTGTVRGLLCHSCNRGIGFLQDSIDILENATKYLKQFSPVLSFQA